MGRSGLRRPRGVGCPAFRCIHDQVARRIFHRVVGGNVVGMQSGEGNLDLAACFEFTAYDACDGLAAPRGDRQVRQPLREGPAAIRRELWKRSSERCEQRVQLGRGRRL